MKNFIKLTVIFFWVYLVLFVLVGLVLFYVPVATIRDISSVMMSLFFEDIWVVRLIFCCLAITILPLFVQRKMERKLTKREYLKLQSTLVSTIILVEIFLVQDSFFSKALAFLGS